MAYYPRKIYLDGEMSEGKVLHKKAEAKLLLLTCERTEKMILPLIHESSSEGTVAV